MCRWVAYSGEKIPLSYLLTEPSHSLIKQSLNAKEREGPVNGDGFGVGWYLPESNPFPAVYNSLTPAWGNRNLRRLAPVIHSPLIFAHVRAATGDMQVSEANCHPFMEGELLFMHNGLVAGFSKIMRTLRRSLSDKTYSGLQGSTDSEHVFAVFLDKLEEAGNGKGGKAMLDALLLTIKQLETWMEEAGIQEASFFNFAVTNGKDLVVTRYTTGTPPKPDSLYFTQAHGITCSSGSCYLTPPKEGEAPAILVASEPLTAERELWTIFPVNTALWVSEDRDLHWRAF